MFVWRCTQQEKELKDISNDVGAAFFSLHSTLTTMGDWRPYRLRDV